MVRHVGNTGEEKKSPPVKNAENITGPRGAQSRGGRKSREPEGLRKIGQKRAWLSGQCPRSKRRKKRIGNQEREKKRIQNWRTVPSTQKKISKRKQGEKRH